MHDSNDWPPAPVASARQQVTDIDSLIEAFRSMSAEEIAARGFTVEGTFDQVDDPILLGPDGLPVNTWKERYPYDERMPRSEYEALKRDLQVELLKAQDWIRSTGHKLVLVFEGRDAAGKGGTIKRFLEHLDPRVPKSSHSGCHRNARRVSGSSSAMCATSRLEARCGSSTGRGTTAPASSG